jgi:hypothetical protein
MRFDFSAVELFLACREGRLSADDLLVHPAYQAVRRHAELFGQGLRPGDIDAALTGRPSPFYGLDHLTERLPRVLALVRTIRTHEQEWTAAAEAALRHLFPAEKLDITVYPTIGYDMGIGLSGVVCLNCNYEGFLADPGEFLYFIVHECVHVVYERYHSIPPLRCVTGPAEWFAYFCTWLQNEGYAVYAPISLRNEAGALAERDYRVLSDPEQPDELRRTALAAIAELGCGRPLPAERYFELCFGPLRLTYRVGCELVRRIEADRGIEAVRRAFRLDGLTFVREYARLLERSHQPGPAG